MSTIKPSVKIKEKIEERGGALRSRQVAGVLDYLDECWANKNRAKNNLKFYFKLLFKKAELRWDNDNDSEIDEIIDSII